MDNADSTGASKNNPKRLRRERRADAVAEYRELTKKITTLRRNDNVKSVQDTIKICLERCKELYPIVKKRLDGTAADSRHMRELLDLCREASKRINVTSKPFELMRIIQNLRRNANEESGKKLTSLEFYRFITERHVSTFLSKPPTFEFFYGTLNADDLIINQRKKKNREKMIESKAVTAAEKDIAIDVEQDSTPKEVEYIHKQINGLTKDRQVNEVPFFGTLVDPKSFIQTVENIFHISFLVKEGKVGVRQDDSEGALLTVETNNNNNNDNRGNNNNRSQETDAKSSTQSVLSFSMNDYKAWISNYNIKKRAFAPRS